VFDTFSNAQSKLDSVAAVSSELSKQPISTSMTRFGIISGFVTCGTIAGYHWSPRLRILLFAQLLALNLLLHGILTMSGESPTMPISLFIASTVGLAYGSLIKTMKDTRQQLIAKDAAIEGLDAELSKSTLQLVKDDETERRVLAGDLHDQVLNDLKLLRERVNKIPKIKSGIESEIASESPGEAIIELEIAEIDGLIDRSMQQIREVMDSLSPAVLQHLGFVDALEDCVRSGSERANYKVRFRCNIEHRDFDLFNQTELTLLYRLVQESVTNICKHAQATIVKCIITADGDNITIAISDDGKGMDVSNRSSQSRGLQYMRQRASIIGATINWRPGEDNKGTSVIITIRKPK